MERRREKCTAIRLASKFLAVTLLAGAVVMCSGASQQPETGRVTIEHTVERGETLWAIAEAHCGDTYIMEYLDTLKKNNPILIEQKGQVYPGQIIKLVKE